MILIYYTFLCDALGFLFTFWCNWSFFLFLFQSLHTPQSVLFIYFYKYLTVLSFVYLFLYLRVFIFNCLKD